MNSQHHPTIRFEHFNFRFDGQHGAHLGPVADRVPKVLAKMFRFHWCEPDCFKCAVFAFFDTKQDDTAIGVGEGGIGLPQAVGKAPRGLFGLNAVVLLVPGDVVQINHGPLLIPPRAIPN